MDDDLKPLDKFMFEYLDCDGFSNKELLEVVISWSKDRPSFNTSYIDKLISKKEITKKERYRVLRIISKFRIDVGAKENGKQII